ncbi:tetratricopeptide repeat protein [Microcoleus sp. S13_C5]|uniref:tetratricopeptide repeat protein n=1 Tax=Microcoleus sp. S13_C5 TaxID=3055411 RepID=UPI002FD67594
MNFFNKIPIALIGTVATIVIAQPTAALAISADEVGKIAKSITVLIDSKNPGSGIIIKRNGNTYTVITARHVFKDAQAKYEIVTPDDKRYLLNYSSVKKLPNIDLAVVEFTSSQTYSVAKIGNSDLATEGKAAYVAGFPKTSAAINRSIYNFTDGRITANASKPINDDGYALVYSNNTLPGMSGGPVLNENGEVVGIHGRADTRAAESSSINQNIQIAKTGFNLGIPINTSLRLLASSQVDLGVKVPSARVATGLKADDFFIQGEEKLNKGDYQGAVAAYSQAIQLNPNYADAYHNRGVARSDLGDNQGAIADYNQALKIDPNFATAYYSRGVARSDLGDKQGAITDYNQALRINPNFAIAYNNRGSARYQLGDKQGAIADYNQALQINSNFATAYLNRGVARSDLGDKQGAIADYNQALRINPNDAEAYSNRGSVRSDLGDKQGAIADYDQALRINPNLAGVYYNRGIARYQLGDKQGAIADFNQALRINPSYAEAYHNRGVARSDLGDNQGEIADYNQALRINPNYAEAYYNRGIARRALGDNQGALSDFQKAADLYQRQGKKDDYQDALNRIRQLQNNTPTRPTSTTLLSANSSLIPGKSSALPSDGSLYEEHTFEGRAGQSVTITLESSDFDTFVALFSPDGKLLAKNDDISRSNTNSALTFTLPASGRYIVVVNAVKKGERGRYTLTIR